MQNANWSLGAIFQPFMFPTPHAWPSIAAGRFPMASEDSMLKRHIILALASFFTAS
jgi:hypothetical protein